MKLTRIIGHLKNSEDVLLRQDELTNDTEWSVLCSMIRNEVQRKFDEGAYSDDRVSDRSNAERFLGDAVPEVLLNVAEVHVVGSLFRESNRESLRGLITVKYMRVENNRAVSRKVRLVGELGEALVTHMRECYDRIVESGDYETLKRELKVKSVVPVEGAAAPIGRIEPAGDPQGGNVTHLEAKTGPKKHPKTPAPANHGVDSLNNPAVLASLTDEEIVILSVKELREYIDHTFTQFSRRLVQRLKRKPPVQRQPQQPVQQVRQGRGDRREQRPQQQQAPKAQLQSIEHVN